MFTWNLSLKARIQVLIQPKHFCLQYLQEFQEFRPFCCLDVRHSHSLCWRSIGQICYTSRMAGNGSGGHFTICFVLHSLSNIEFCMQKAELEDPIARQEEKQEGQTKKNKPFEFLNIHSKKIADSQMKLTSRMTRLQIHGINGYILYSFSNQLTPSFPYFLPSPFLTCCVILLTSFGGKGPHLRR